MIDSPGDRIPREQNHIDVKGKIGKELRSKNYHGQVYVRDTRKYYLPQKCCPRL